MDHLLDTQPLHLVGKAGRVYELDDLQTLSLGRTGEFDGESKGSLLILGANCE